MIRRRSVSLSDVIILHVHLLVICHSYRKNTYLKRDTYLHREQALQQMRTEKRKNKKRSCSRIRHISYNVYGLDISIFHQNRHKHIRDCTINSLNEQRLNQWHFRRRISRCRTKSVVYHHVQFVIVFFDEIRIQSSTCSTVYRCQIELI